ncbi:MAG TPA: M56 family metallopeptidase [Candidatus Acidoferrales bacterium]|jgi:uncharacterized protein (TIGR03435 family)
MIPAFFALPASHLWQSTLFAAAVALLTLALRRNQAGVRYWLWLAASCKFLLPFLWLVSIGHHFQWQAAQAIVPPGISAVVDAVNAPVFLTTISAAQSAPSHLSLVLYIVWAVWACGFITVIGGWVVEWQRIRRIVLVASPLNLGLPIRVVSTPARLEPGVFGIFRPVLVLPEGIAAHLTQAQLETVIAHELCHVSRRDNLTAAIHMLVEALFWFHPLVWWLGARLIEERECACDQKVLQVGSHAQVYAESILKVCEFYLECPLKCVSGISGSDLEKRMERIMKKHFGEVLSPRKKILLASAAVVALAAPVVAGVLTSTRLPARIGADQSSVTLASRPKFETASIKLSEPGSQGTYLRRMPGGVYSATNAPLRALIASAYQNEFPPKGELIFGGPGWVDSALFNIEAKAGNNSGNAQTHLMVQSLLEDRFKLEIHHETRLLPIYALVLATPGRTGTQLTPHSPEAKCTVADGTPGKGLPQPAAGEAMPSYCGGFFMNPRPGDLRETGNGITMDMLGQFLRQSVDRTIVDRTELGGVFDFSFEFSPEQGPGAQSGATPNASNPSAPPSIFNALPEELGLKLEPQTGPVDVIVIDHIEEPLSD